MDISYLQGMLLSMIFEMLVCPTAVPFRPYRELGLSAIDGAMAVAINAYLGPVALIAWIVMRVVPKFSTQSLSKTLWSWFKPNHSRAFLRMALSFLTVCF